jgi:hypothetical protein
MLYPLPNCLKYYATLLKPGMNFRSAMLSIQRNEVHFLGYQPVDSTIMIIAVQGARKMCFDFWKFHPYTGKSDQY